MRVCVPCYNVDNIPSCVLLSTKFEKLIWGSTICFPLCENKTKQSQQEIPSNSTCPTYCWRGCFKKMPTSLLCSILRAFLTSVILKVLSMDPWGSRGPYRESTHCSAFLVRRGHSLPFHGADLCDRGAKAVPVQIFLEVPISFTVTGIPQWKSICFIKCWLLSTQHLIILREEMESSRRDLDAYRPQ